MESLLSSYGGCDMSYNNIIPWWLLVLGEQERVLSTAEMLDWLYEEGVKSLPEAVYHNQVALYIDKLDKEREQSESRANRLHGV